MNNPYLQVRTFDDYTKDSQSECNEFLKKLGGRVKDVNTHYNTILGGIIYTVIFWE